MKLETSKDTEIAELKDKLAWCKRELDLERRINLDEIDRLMELAIVVDRLRKHRMNTDYLDAMDMAKMIVKEHGK